MSAHHEFGEAIMNGRFGRKNADSIKLMLEARLRSLDPGLSYQRRTMRNGAITTAICFTAMARPSDTQLALGLRYHRTAVRTRKKAQTLSVQLPAITIENRLKGARLMLFSLAGARPNIRRIDMMWKMDKGSRKSCRPTRKNGRTERQLRE